MAVLAVTYSVIPIAIEAVSAAFTGDTTSPKGYFRPNLDDVIGYGPFVFAGIGLIYALAQYCQSRLTLGAALNTLRDIQNAMMKQFLELDLTSQQQEQSGALASRFTNDIQLLRETLTRMTNGVRDLLQLIALCTTLIFYDWVLFAIVICVYGIIGWPIAWLGKILRRTAKRAQSETGNLAGAVTEIAGGTPMIKSYNLETAQTKRMHALFENRTKLLKKAAYLRAFNEPFIFLVGAIAMGIVVAVMAARIRLDIIDGPAVAGFLVALLLLSQPARGLSTLYAVLQEGLAAFERILMIIDNNSNADDEDKAAILQVNTGEIKFDAVSFSYKHEIKAVRDISLTIEPGKTAALVGESGAGKTTLLHLLVRLYEIQDGSIHIDNQDIQSVSLSSLREKISIVSQDGTIFNDSLYNNIAFGNLNATKDEIIEAAKAATIHEFIQSLPEQYETLAGENGNRLSGGQKQRIAIARAFLKNAPILLLDEPTSSLDAESEAAIQKSLEMLKEKRTTLIVAHRLSTIRNADKIIVMDSGKIIETGTHEELQNKSSAYKRLVDLQFGN